MMFETRDSGERVEMQGMVRDSNHGKPRFDLVVPKTLPLDETLLYRWASLLARGAEKYNARNWEGGRGEEVFERFLDSAERHFRQWVAQARARFYGTAESDEVMSEDHAAGAIFNIQGAEHTIYHHHHTEIKVVLNPKADDQINLTDTPLHSVWAFIDNSTEPEAYLNLVKHQNKCLCCCTKLKYDDHSFCSSCLEAEGGGCCDAFEGSPREAYW